MNQNVYVTASRLSRQLVIITGFERRVRSSIERERARLRDEKPRRRESLKTKVLCQEGCQEFEL